MSPIHIRNAAENQAQQALGADDLAKSIADKYCSSAAPQRDEAAIAKRTASKYCTVKGRRLPRKAVRP
jgi:hypothetical protein